MPPKAQRTKKPLAKKLILSRASDLDDEDYGPPGPDELDLQRGFKRPKLSKPFIDDEVSDYVTVRLAVIRAKALQKHREIMYNKAT